MKKIQCQNCGTDVSFTKELRCDACNIKLYGFNINTLPQEYRQLMNQQQGNGETPRAMATAENRAVSPAESAPTLAQATKPRPAERPMAAAAPSRKLPEHPGWLIVHTEGKEAIDFELVEGMNYIGRPVKIGIKPHIQVPEDKYVSRGHAVLYISKNPLGKYQYTLTDSESNLRQAPSLNGTYLNGHQNRVDMQESVWLQDGHTVQIGETKLVLKTAEVAADVDEAKTQVLEMDYEKTILINA